MSALGALCAAYGDSDEDQEDTQPTVGLVQPTVAAVPEFTEAELRQKRVEEELVFEGLLDPGIYDAESDLVEKVQTHSEKAREKGFGITKFIRDQKTFNNPDLIKRLRAQFTFTLKEQDVQKREKEQQQQQQLQMERKMSQPADAVPKSPAELLSQQRTVSRWAAATAAPGVGMMDPAAAPPPAGAAPPAVVSPANPSPANPSPGPTASTATSSPPLPDVASIVPAAAAIPPPGPPAAIMSPPGGGASPPNMSFLGSLTPEQQKAVADPKLGLTQAQQQDLLSAIRNAAQHLLSSGSRVPGASPSPAGVAVASPPPAASPTGSPPLQRAAAPGASAGQPSAAATATRSQEPGDADGEPPAKRQNTGEA